MDAICLTSHKEALSEVIASPRVSIYDSGQDAVKCRPCVDNRAARSGYECASSTGLCKVHENSIRRPPIRHAAIVIRY